MVFNDNFWWIIGQENSVLCHPEQAREGAPKDLALSVSKPGQDSSIPLRYTQNDSTRGLGFVSS